MKYINRQQNGSYGTYPLHREESGDNGQYLKKEEIERWEYNVIKSTSSESLIDIKSPDVLDVMSNLAPGAAIAGGVWVRELTGETSGGDIDVFFLGRQAFSDTYDRLRDGGWYVDDLENYDASNFAGTKLINLTKRGIKDWRNVQLIKMQWYGFYHDIPRSFDLVHCMISRSSNDVWHYAKGALELIEKRQIQINNSPNPLTTLHRIKNYCDRGWTINGVGWPFSDQKPRAEKIVMKQERHIPVLNEWPSDEYKRDYYEMDPVSFMQKWKNRIKKNV